MDYSIVATALSLTAYLLWPLLLAVLAGALIASVIRVVTQIDDAVLGLIGKLIAVCVFLYFGSGYLSSEVIGFTESIWGVPDYFH